MRMLNVYNHLSLDKIAVDVYMIIPFQNIIWYAVLSLHSSPTDHLQAQSAHPWQYQLTANKVSGINMLIGKLQTAIPAGPTRHSLGRQRQKPTETYRETQRQKQTDAETETDKKEKERAESSSQRNEKGSNAHKPFVFWGWILLQLRILLSQPYGTRYTSLFTTYSDLSQ